jgi:hypothetical protein
MDILKFKDGYVGKPGLVYGGRPKKEALLQGQLLIGLGNPYSWKKSKYVKGKVRDLAESLFCYRSWLATRIVDACKNGTSEKLKAWEQDYLTKVLALCQAIKAGRVRGLVCWCIDYRNYVPVKGLADKKCHTQILYNCCLMLIEQGLVNRESVLDLQTGNPIDVFDLW